MRKAENGEDDGLKVVENRFSVERLSPRYTKAVDEPHLACARSVPSKRRAALSELKARRFGVTAPTGSASRHRTRKPGAQGSDGSQPHELARTRSFTYATMNATLFCELALLGEKIGVDLWCYETSDALAIYQHFT